jgi:DNA-binding CsgD family transcriptional regulator
VLLIVFYGAYTLQTFVTLIEELALSDGPIPTATLLWVSFSLDTFLGTIVVAAATLYFHELFLSAGRRFRDALVMAVASVEVLLFAPPFSVSVRPVEGVLVLGIPAYAAGIVYHLLFAYLLFVGFSGSKRDRPVRELLLIWTTLVFGSVGFLESVVSTAQYLRDPIVRIVYSEERFPISIVPHILMGVVMIYYFGGYILADRLPQENAVPATFLGKYNISPRELEVMALMDRGLSNREIADKLFVSLATVKTHAHNIYEKTGAKSRYGLSHMVRTAKG